MLDKVNLDKDRQSGVIVIDKPAHISSAKAVAFVKSVLKAKKAGHTGTLDPFATGVLVCCINRATKLARFFLDGSKKYTAVLHLGVQTETQDSSGKVTARCEPIAFSDEMIHAAIKKFEGTINQTPPYYSALKYKGIPLYRYARWGRPVQKPPRRVHIASIQPLEINLPLVSFDVWCSAGTYIRTLCADIGNALGCGGHLKELRRIECCGFSIDETVPLYELEKRVLNGGVAAQMFSMADALRGISAVAADENLASKIKRGMRVQKKELNPRLFHGPEGFIKFIDSDNQLIAVMKQTPADDNLHYCCVFPN